MSATSPRWAALPCLCVLLFSSACFRTTAPRGWLSTPAEAQPEAYGGWIKVEYTLGAANATVQGELIAAEPDSIHVLTADSLVAVVTGAVISATLTTYDARVGNLRTWTILGSLSTVSHGYWLILSMPIWIIAGTVATASASKAPRVQSIDASLLRPYARFPQGMPLTLDRQSLRPKGIRTRARR